MSLESILTKVNAHFANSTYFVESDMPYHLRLRNFTKWWFDLIKNAIVVVALQVLADKAKSSYVTVLYFFSNFVLLAFCMSYLQTWLYYPFGRDAKRFLGIISIGAGAVIFLALWLGVSRGEQAVLDALARAQSR
jgi:hypothetical protein